MHVYECRGWVQLRRPDGASLGDVQAQLWAQQRADGQLDWHGVLRAGITPTTTRWPANEPVVLECPDGQDLTVWLEPAVVECGPVLLQVARARQREAAGARRESAGIAGDSRPAACTAP
jgi:hypothetical protein